MTFIAQTRRNENHEWQARTRPHGEHQTAYAAAWSLNDDMQLAGFRFSELADHRADLQAGHVLTAEDGRQFRVIPAEPVAEPEPTVTLTRDELLFLLTSAACIGREFAGHGGVGMTRGDLTEYLLTYPAMRDALPNA